MKFYRTLCLAAVIALPQIASVAANVPPSALGQVEATVSFCSRVDSKNADKYKGLGKQVVAGMTDKELAEVRDSSEYKDSFASITAQLEKLPSDKAVEGCRAAIGGK